MSQEDSKAKSDLRDQVKGLLIGLFGSCQTEV
jgi:hypothetical protein